MKNVQTEVLVIGGGATGSGVAWDAATRGFETILVERKDLAEGTTGRFHGLLHSGGRYAVKDRGAAEECIQENRILRRVASDTIEDTGGYFVTTPWDDPAFGDRFMEGCRACEIPVEEIAPSEAFQAEPRINRDISRVFTVPDAAIDGWKLVWDCARATTEHGGRVFTYHKVLDILRSSDAVGGARVRNELSGEEFEIHADFTINATGAWAGKVADMAGCPDVQVLAGKGIMIAMNHRLVNTVINRCTMPADGDILVPIRTVSVIGTTDIRIKDPDEPDVTQDEVDRMLDDGEKLVPGFRKARALRVWAGVRPLFKDARAAETTDTRDVSRSHALLDHKDRDGVTGFLTITGGKLTTFRMMAEETVDMMCEQLGTQRVCRTSADPLPSSKTGKFMWLGERLKEREATMHEDQLICECELIQRSSLERVMTGRSSTILDDIRRALRLGMGPCQGGFCMYRATGILHDVERMDSWAANRSLRDFLQERWKGVQPILYGDQLRQARLDDWIFQGVLDVEHLPTDQLDDHPASDRP
jgi:glycerol-3-phosphate dehydrogenase